MIEIAKSEENIGCQNSYLIFADICKSQPKPDTNIVLFRNVTDPTLCINKIISVLSLQNMSAKLGNEIGFFE